MFACDGRIPILKRLIEKHPLAIRWFHWINFPLIFLMIWSGLLIYWAGSDERLVSGVYRIGANVKTTFPLFLRFGVAILPLSRSHHVTESLKEFPCHASLNPKLLPSARRSSSAPR